MQRYYYLLSLLLIFAIPAGIAGVTLWAQIDPVQLLIFVAIVTLMGSIYDVWAAKHGKHDKDWLWEFHHSQTLGIKILDIPIEEYLFYVATSAYVVLIWEEINLLRSGDNSFAAFTLIPGLGLWTLASVLTMQLLFKRKGRRRR